MPRKFDCANRPGGIQLFLERICLLQPFYIFAAWDVGWLVNAEEFETSRPFYVRGKE
jgi:hypothetical protein